MYCSFLADNNNGAHQTVRIHRLKSLHDAANKVTIFLISLSSRLLHFNNKNINPLCIDLNFKDQNLLSIQWCCGVNRIIDTELILVL